MGRAILLTGAGFSLRAKDANGRSIPSVGQLTRELWDVAFRDRPYDGSSLGDVYEAGMLLARRTIEQVMRERLTRRSSVATQRVSVVVRVSVASHLHAQRGH